MLQQLNIDVILVCTISSHGAAHSSIVPTHGTGAAHSSTSRHANSFSAIFVKPLMQLQVVITPIILEENLRHQHSVSLEIPS